MEKKTLRELVDEEMERRYGHFSGEHPDRAKIREILETEPLAKCLAMAEIYRELKSKK